MQADYSNPAFPIFLGRLMQLEQRSGLVAPAKLQRSPLRHLDWLRVLGFTLLGEFAVEALDFGSRNAQLSSQNPKFRLRLLQV